jgi:Family of unknown function (DUF5677)
MLEAMGDEAIRSAEAGLRELAKALDEPVVNETYSLAISSLGHRSRSLYQAFVELHRGEVSVAARGLLRTMVEINIFVRFLRKSPALHTELWHAEGERNTIAMAEEVGRTPHLRARFTEDALDSTELARRRERVAKAREQAIAAGLPVKTGSLLPAIPAQLKAINEPAADAAYTFAYRALNWDVHGGARAFLIGECTTHHDGRVSYQENITAKQALPTRALAAATFASTLELVAAELSLAIQQAASAIRLSIVRPDSGAGTESG